MSEADEIVLLRTMDDAPVRGQALLIGAPLGRLVGVRECLDGVQAWLELNRLERVSSAPATAVWIEQRMDELVATTGEGDFVLVYYVGHGVQIVLDDAAWPWILGAQLPMDAIEREVVVTGERWRSWMIALSERARPDLAGTPGVTVILECCHAQALFAPWPHGDAEQTLMQRIRAGLARRGKKLRGSLNHVTQIFASGRDENARIGEMTNALLECLHRHHDEPWWAIMDRVRAEWSKPQQHPSVAGASDRIPLSADRLRRPEGLLPCVRRESGWWVEHATSAGWEPGHCVGLTPTLRLPPRAWAEVEAEPERLRVLDSSEEWQSIRFAWARLSSHERRATVAVTGSPPLRAALVQRLVPLARSIADEPTRSTAIADPLAHFHVEDDTVEMRDRDGDVLIRTPLDASATWAAWLERLLTIDRWLAVAGRAPAWASALRLRWGTWAGENRVEWITERPEIPSTRPSWLEVETEPEVRAYVSVFRISADRSIQELTPQDPHGIPIGGRACVATLSTDAEAPRPHDHAAPRSGRRKERLVVMASRRPIPLSLLARGAVAVPTAAPSSTHRDADDATRLAMIVRSYWLEP